MKGRRVAAAVLAMLFLLAQRAWAVDISATAAVLMERQTGTVLYEKEAHRHLSPASVTKVMTLLLVAEAVESGAVSPDDPVTASRRAASSSIVSSVAGSCMAVPPSLRCLRRR